MTPSYRYCKAEGWSRRLASKALPWGAARQRLRTARIVETDVVVSNGVIHAIDNVILPAP